MTKVAGSIAEGVMALSATAAVITASIALRSSRQIEWREFANSYFKEYRTIEMGRAVARLYRLQKESRENLIAIVSSYITEYQKQTRLHLEIRRKVSAFYQEVSNLAI
jgi:hypothetical protein